MTVSRDVFRRGYDRLTPDEYHDLLRFIALGQIEYEDLPDWAKR